MTEKLSSNNTSSQNEILEDVKCNGKLDRDNKSECGPTTVEEKEPASDSDQNNVSTVNNNEPVSTSMQDSPNISKSESVTEYRPKDESEKETSKGIDHLPVSRLLKPPFEGIRERIELLGELLRSQKRDPIPDVYDEMGEIVEATERNERLKAGPDGERLLQLTTAARSNLNIDLHNLDLEIQRQFGLHSVEVTGDGACAFRAILISGTSSKEAKRSLVTDAFRSIGMQKPDLYHSQMRAQAIEQVLSDTSYYSTVLRPGDTVTKNELEDWKRSMDDPNTYGDELANRAVVDRYHIRLVIFRAGELLIVVNPRDGQVEYTAFLVNVGTHYKALVPKNELDEARQNSERLCQ